MSQAYEFLKECGSFFVLTINGDYPAGRPFGAVMKIGEDLYLSTNDMNQAHKQMREHLLQKQGLRSTYFLNHLFVKIQATRFLKSYIHDRSSLKVRT